MSEDLSDQRFRLLLEQLGEELGHAWGWKSKTARQVGMDQALAAKVRAGERGVGRDSIERAIKTLGIRREFFYDPKLRNPKYRDFLTGDGVPEEPEVVLDSDRGVNAVEEFLSTQEAEERVTVGQAKRLRSIRWGGVTPTVGMVRDIWVRMSAEEQGKLKPATPRKTKRRPGRVSIKDD